MEEADPPPAARMELQSELAGHIEERATAITDLWLEALDERLGVRPTRLLPHEELRDHIPSVIASLGQVLRLPGSGPPAETYDHLRHLAELRREQGYDVLEILREFGILSDIVFEEATAWLGERELPVADAGPVYARLRQGMEQLSMITVDAYQSAHLIEQRTMSERLTEFVRTLKHEILEPLQAAMGSVEMVRRDEVGEKSDLRREYAELIQDRLERVRDLVDDVGEIAIAEEAGSRARRAPLQDVIRSVLKEVERLADREGVDVRVDEPIPEVQVDARRVEIVLMNLVTNAIKYSDPEKEERWVRLTVEEREGADAGPEWELSVADNGIGIPDGLGERIYHRLFRANADRADGTGMGLAIARDTVRRWEGEISFESEEGEGTTFYLTFPELPSPEEMGQGGPSVR